MKIKELIKKYSKTEIREIGRRIAKNYSNAESSSVIKMAKNYIDKEFEKIKEETFREILEVHKFTLISYEEYRTIFKDFWMEHEYNRHVERPKYYIVIPYNKFKDPNFNVLFSKYKMLEDNILKKIDNEKSRSYRKELKIDENVAGATDRLSVEGYEECLKYIDEKHNKLLKEINDIRKPYAKEYKEVELKLKEIIKQGGDKIIR